MVAAQLPFEVSTGSDANVVTIKHRNFTAKSEQWYLLRSDAHFDNPDSNWELQIEHLKEARRRRAGVLDFGDLFCAMQGKYDKRSNKSKVRPEHQVDDYLDALVRTAADFYEPYADLWVMQGCGNHEASILQRHETNLIDRWAQVMRDRTSAAVPVTGYTGWVSFHFHLTKTQRTRRRLWHTHGYGGGGPVTKDMIQRNRQLAYIDNADIIVSGHTHDQWVTKDMRLTLSGSDRVVQRPCVVVKCPTYKDEYKTGVGGWHIATGKPPKPIGAYWLRFFVGSRRSGRRTEQEIKFEIREAEV